MLTNIRLYSMNILKAQRKIDKTKIKWTNDCANATLLVYPKVNEIALKVDAFDIGIGAVLEQKEGDSWKPLAFFSRKLSTAEQNYSAYDRELLAAFAGIKHFRFMLEGGQFTLFTDHKPLIFAFQQKPEKASPRQTRQLDYISQFTTDINTSLAQLI